LTVTIILIKIITINYKLKLQEIMAASHRTSSYTPPEGAYYSEASRFIAAFSPSQTASSSHSLSSEHFIAGYFETQRLHARAASQGGLSERALARLETTQREIEQIRTQFFPNPQTFIATHLKSAITNGRPIEECFDIFKQLNVKNKKIAYKLLCKTQGITGTDVELKARGIDLFLANPRNFLAGTTSRSTSTAVDDLIEFTKQPEIGNKLHAAILMGKPIEACFALFKSLSAENKSEAFQLLCKAHGKTGSQAEIKGQGIDLFLANPAHLLRINPETGRTAMADLQLFIEGKEQLPPPPATPIRPVIFKRIVEHLAQSHTSTPLEFSANGVRYYAWYVERHHAFNIQPVDDYNSRAPRNQFNKLGMQVDADGNIQSVYFNNQAILGNALPLGTRDCIFGLYSICPKPPEFSAEDLLTFRATLIKLNSHVNDPKVVRVADKHYIIWQTHLTTGPYAGQYALNVQPYEEFQGSTQIGKLGIIIDDQGTISSIRWENRSLPEDSTTIPEELIPLLQSCLIEALRISSTYQVDAHRDLQIHIVRRGLQEVPEFHLDQLGTELTRSRHLHITFLRTDLEEDTGIDAGGLSRDYLDDLSSGILVSKYLRFQKVPSSGLSLPRTKQDYKDGQPLPQISGDEKQIYEHLGRLMMFCYNSNGTLSIGRHLDESLFKAALSLTAEEIDAPFDRLNLATHAKLCKALAGGETTYDRFFALLQKPSLDDDEWQEASMIAMGSLPEDFEYDATDPTHKAIIRQALADTIFSSIGGTTLAPIQAIARGMRSLFRGTWNTDAPRIDYLQFSNAVQGTMNRRAIADAIQPGGSASSAPHAEKREIEKKVQWLKEWILDDSTDEKELRDLLKAATGCSSLPPGRRILIQKQSLLQLTPAPAAHSCFYTLDIAPVPVPPITASAPALESDDTSLPNDHTKEAFIRAMKEILLAGSGSYSMG
jgi:hypothetical protein